MTLALGLHLQAVLCRCLLSFFVLAMHLIKSLRLACCSWLQLNLSLIGLLARLAGIVNSDLLSGPVLTSSFSSVGLSDIVAFVVDVFGLRRFPILRT